MSNKGLTPREKEIMGLISHGKTSEDIALCLSISAETVRCHLTNVRMKLDATNTPQAVALAIRRGFLSA